MKSIFIVAAAMLAITSCTPSFKANLTPSNLVVVDEIVIVTKLGSKTGEWKMPFLSDKGSRRGPIKKWNGLHKEALGLHQSQKMALEDYMVYSDASELVSQLLWLVGAIESGEKVNEEAKGIYEQLKSGNYKPANKIVSGTLTNLFKKKSGNEGMFDALLEEANSVFDEFLANYRK